MDKMIRDFHVGFIVALLLGAILSGGRVLLGAEEFPDTLPGIELIKITREAIGNKGWDRAKEALEKLLKKESPTAEVMVYLGQTELRRGKEKDAEKAFKEALRLDKKRVEALEGLLEVYLIRDKEKEMLNFLKHLKSVDPDNINNKYYLALAVDRFKLKGYEETFFWDTMEDLVRANPEDQRILNTLCDAYINDKFYERGVLFLNEMIDTLGEKPELHFQLARIYTHTGDKDLARDMFHKIEENGLEQLPPRHRFLMAKELFRLEEGSLGCLAYFSAARDADDELALEAFNDLRDITVSDERRELNLTPSGKKGIFLISFWGRKDPTPTTVKNERLIEHYSRIETAHEKYYSPLKPGYDERGRVYIKHGEPDQKISLSGNWAVRENESWLYSKNRSNPLIYHFVERNNYYRMVYRLEEALVTDLESEMAMGGRNAVELMRSRAEIDPKYDQLANELQNWQGGSIENARHGSLMDIFADEELLTERGFTEGEISETYKYEFEEEPMNFYYFPVSLKSSDSLSALGVFFALPTDQVKVPDPFGTVEIPVELEVVLYDSWWQEKTRIDQSKTYRVPNFIADKERLIPDLIGLNVSPGNYHMAVRMKQAKGNLMQIYKSNFFVHSYRDPDSLYLSDLILGTNVVEDDTPGKFNIRGYRITPMPSASFKKDQPIYVYYELYNLVPDQMGAKHIRMEYLLSSSGESLSVAQKIISTLGRFIGVRNEVGKVITTFERDFDRPGNIDPIYLSIDPSEYLPGNYNLLVTVQDTVSGQSAAKDVTILITK
ncbi:MAG TPA: GWxTD domain-containing protein [archaeon]|nr:GWxTD domain-containing protein [archaeon]